MPASSLIFTAIWISCVAAHGGIYTYDIEGMRYQGNPWHIWDYGPFYGDGDPSGIPAGIESIQRRWWFWPVYDITSGNMTCNFDGKGSNNSIHAPVNAGDTIIAHYNALEFNLTTVDKVLWYHQYGPLLVYMARCPGTSCHGFDGKGPVWFKIAQYGLDPTATSLRGPWQHVSMLTEATATGFPAVIPRHLKAGNYLIRHEVINLQSNKVDGAQFYIQCAQLRVEGSGTRFPDRRYMAEFPGTYKSSDPGIAMASTEISDGNLLPLYNTTIYSFPGPPKWTGENS